MVLEIIAVLCAGVAAGGVLLLVAKVLRVKPPRWALPVVAAAAMIAFTIWARYTWAERAIAGLPPGVVAVATYPQDGWLLEPWTILWPRDDKYLALDTRATMRNPQHPDVYLVTTALVQEYVGSSDLRQFVDCVRRRRAPFLPGMPLDDSGMPPADAWIDGGEPVALFDAVCKAPPQTPEPSPAPGR